MSLLQIHPTDRTVVTDASGRPIQVVVSDQPLVVDVIETVREEIAAYPVATGPRTLFTVSAGGARLRLVHELRVDRWTVAPLQSEPAILAPAA